MENRPQSSEVGTRENVTHTPCFILACERLETPVILLNRLFGLREAAQNRASCIKLFGGLKLQARRRFGFYSCEGLPSRDRHRIEYYHLERDD
jgi:hypothetical protein